jgi:hypothetical protein
MRVIVSFPLAIDVRRPIVLGRVLDRLPTQDRYPAIFPTYLGDPLRADKRVFPTPPVTGIDDDVPNRPGVVLDEKIVDMPQLAIDGFQMVARDLACTAQMVVPPE